MYYSTLYRLKWYKDRIADLEKENAALNTENEQLLDKLLKLQVQYDRLKGAK